MGYTNRGLQSQSSILSLLSLQPVPGLFRKLDIQHFSNSVRYITKKDTFNEDVFFIVRRMRLELTRPCSHYPLKVACIPISPPALVFIL